MPITELLEKNARLYPDEVALVEVNPANQPEKDVTWREFNLIESARSGKYRREMTWKRFDVDANKIANFLLTRGIKRGDKVAILMMNCLEWLPVYFAVLKTGAIVVPMNFRYTAEEIKYCVDLADVRMLVFGPEFISRIEQVRCEMKTDSYFFVGEEAETPDFADLLWKMASYCSSTPPAVALSEEDYAAIYFSSGTTGFPKAILHAHKALTCSCITEQNHHGQTREDVFLCIPPLYHTGAKMHWFGSLLSGSRTVLLRGVSPEWVLQTVSAEHCSIVWLLVPWVQDILDAIDSGRVNLDDYNLSHWRLMHIGAQPVPPSLIKRWKHVFPHHEYDTNYGLSESIGPGCVHLGVENIHKVGAIGKAGYLWETAILDENRQPVLQGEVGELAVKGPGVMLCYYKNPEASKEILMGDWLLTGDMAKEDEDGFIYLVDRKKDVIISGGENLYPVQIEDFLRSNDKIKDVAVIGFADQRLGEIAVAIVEIKEGVECTEEELFTFCEDMPRYKRPKKFIFDKVPRNPTGKIEKPVLRQRYRTTKLIEAESTK